MKAWQQLLSDLEHELGASIVKQWLRPLKIIRFDAANLVLGIEDPMQASWFEEHIRPRLKKNGFYNENHRPIKIHLQTQNSNTSNKVAAPTPSSFRPDTLDATYRFENFVVCPNNTMARKLFAEWTATGASPFNPIFLYGPKGCGKTHLLTAAAHHLIAAKKNCIFVTAATFTEHVVQAIRSSSMLEFRKIYRDIDVLMVDNVDQFRGRTATQEEFFHTFNTLHTLGKQIVLSSLSPPSKLSEIEARLISRFEWGVSIGLEKASAAQILTVKADQWNIPLSPALSVFLLEKFPIHFIIALQALALRSSSKQSISVDSAKKLLSDLLRKEEADAITPDKIIKALASHFGIKTDDLIGKSQMREFAFPRQIAMFLCRKVLKMPFQAIGQFFDRDHSTVMSSVKQIQKGIDQKDASIMEAVESASCVLKN